MTFSIIPVLAAVTVYFASAQDSVVYPSESSDGSNLNRNSLTMDGIPERLLLLMRNIDNATDFLNHFVVPEGGALLPKGGQQSFMNANGEIGFVNARRALAAAAGLDIAQFAVCRPELQMVKLQKPASSGVMLWPPCVRLRRCGGCCTSKLLACRPVLLSTINITVLQVRISPQLLDAFESEGQRVISLEQHDRCACGCKQLPEQCVPGVQEYRPSECRCVCLNHELAMQCIGPERVWDSADCSCKCRHPAECSTGFYFSFRTCRCEVFRDSLLGFRPQTTRELRTPAERSSNGTT